MDENMDLSGAVDMLKDMLSNEEGQQQIQNILGMFGGGQEESGSPGMATGGIDPDNVEMMLKIQQVMAAMNSRKNDSQTRFLQSLKPFLKPERQKKVDSAVRLLGMTRALEVMKSMNGG